ncbi:hypothetical protein Bbelb_396710 [Branchiostoma belcheri]|nr:hypothetical protein Bbelb_396710 [Branchiostoma belcheri]
MESIIHKYQDVDEEEGDFVTLDNLNICVDKGQLRHQEAAHFGFLQAALPEDSATPHGSHDDRELVSYPELDDEQPTLGVMMLRDFGNRMEQSICMRSKKSDDGKVYWEPEDDVEEDMLTIGDNDSDRGDISSDEDKWAETGKENDARRRSTVEKNEESPEDSRGSAESDEYDAWRRSPLEQTEESPEDSRGSEIYKSKESMEMPADRYRDKGSHRMSADKHNKPTNISAHGSTSSAGEREDELSGSGGFSYEEAHRSKTPTGVSSNDHKKGKSEKHMKKTNRKCSDRDVIDLLTEPDEQSEMGNVTPVHHRSFSNAEKPDQGARRRNCFSVPAKRRIMSLTSSRDADINSSSSAASPKMHLLTHEDICDLLGEQPSTTHQGMKQRVKYKYVPSASMALQSVEEYGDSQKGKSDTGLGKQQDCKEVQLSSKDSGTKVTRTASTLNTGKKVSVSKPHSTKEKLVVEPFKQRLHQSGSSQDESLTDSNSSFHSLSDEYPQYQREGSENTEALQTSTSYSEDENCSSKPDHSIEMEHSNPKFLTYSPQFSVESSIKHVEEQLPSVKSLKSSQGALMTPLTPILKTPGQRSATPSREKTQKKRVYFSADPTNVEEQSMQDTLQLWKSRMQQSKVNHDDSEVDLPSPEPHQEDQHRQETSEEILEEPAFSLLSVGDELSHLHKSAAIQTSTPRRDADKPRFSTPKGRKIPQEDEAPSPCTLMRNQLDNIKLGSPIQKGPSTKQNVLNNQSPEKMEVDESPKCSTDWTKQFANRERRKMDYGLTERKSDRESRILRVNTSNSSFSDAAAFSQLSASSGEKDNQTASNILTRRSSRLNSTNVVTAPKTDPRHNKKGTKNRPFDVTRRLNRSEVLDVQTSEINSDKGRTWLFKQPESPYILRPRRTISSSDDQDVKDSPRKTSSRQNTRHTTAKGRQTERLSRSVEKRKTDKFLLTPSQARAVDRQRKDTRQWGWRHSSFSSEAETTSSTQQVSSPEVGERRVTRSQSSSDMDTVEWNMTRGQMWPDTRGKKVTKRNGQSVTVGKTPGSAVNQSKGQGRRRIIDISSSDEEVRSTPRKASSTQGIKYKKGKERLTRKGD